MSRAEIIKMISEASPEDLTFLEKQLAELHAKETAQKNTYPSPNDPFYRLHELAVEDLKPLTNGEIDAIVYGLD
ncbi:MAG: hypothetical protein QOD03_1408 [Verrucomicrobiota bacterium]|jgi:hypothetical protein